MTYRSDRSRIEEALSARLLRRCWAGIIEGHRDHGRPADPDHLALLEDLRLQSGLAAHADLWEAVNHSAAKQARKLHDGLMDQGCFQHGAGAVAA